MLLIVNSVVLRKKVLKLWLFLLYLVDCWPHALHDFLPQNAWVAFLLRFVQMPSHSFRERSVVFVKFCRRNVCVFQLPVFSVLFGLNYCRVKRIYVCAVDCCLVVSLMSLVKVLSGFDTFPGG